MPRDQKDHSEPEYNPKLICRTFIGDDGARPLDPSVRYYESPSIRVMAPDGSDIPVAGAVNRVHVDVENLGNAPAYGVQVELYWCNPTVGVNLANATIIGSLDDPITLYGREHKTLTFDWVPDFVNEGHECLVVQVYDPVIDNLVAPFNPVLDPHVAHRNVNVIQVAAGGSLELHFYASNISRLPGKAEIAVERVTGEALQLLARTLGHGVVPEFVGASAAITKIEESDAQPKLDLARHPAAAVFRETLERAPGPYTRTLLLGALAALPTADCQKKDVPDRLSTRGGPIEKTKSATVREARSLHLPPGKEFRLTLTISVPPEARKGTYTAFRIVETVADQVTGGISYFVRVGM